MAHHDTVENMARQLVAVILRDPCWDARIDDICQTLRDDSRRARPKQAMMAVAARAETILRHIAQGDWIAIGRLYFDLLPGLGHPLTQAVVEALRQPEAALRLLRDGGFHPVLKKDGTGTTILEIEVSDDTGPICAVTRDAVLQAMGDGEAGAVSLYTLH